MLVSYCLIEQFFKRHYPRLVGLMLEKTQKSFGFLLAYSYLCSMVTEMNEELRKRFNPEGSMLRRQQMRMLEILLEVDRICKKHDIPYWLSSGTLIGAMRHDGFIPWDDDLDIEMLRSDYLRLMEVLPKELPDWLARTTSTSTPRCATAVHGCWSRTATTVFGRNRVSISISSRWSSILSGCTS